MANPSSKKTPRKPRCFVISPIDNKGTETRKRSDLVLNSIIKPSLKKVGIDHCVRADQFASPGMINDKVIEAIIEYELAIADLTDLNPNVFYELGLRHLQLKPVIHIAANGTKLPFDNNGYGTVFFDICDWDSQEEARQQIESSALEALSETHSVSNPVTQARASIAIAQSADPKDKVISAMGRQLDFLSKEVEKLNSMQLLEQPQNRLLRSIENPLYNALMEGISETKLSDDDFARANRLRRRMKQQRVKKDEKDS